MQALSITSDKSSFKEEFEVFFHSPSLVKQDLSKHVQLIDLAKKATILNSKDFTVLSDYREKFQAVLDRQDSAVAIQTKLDSAISLIEGIYKKTLNLNEVQKPRCPLYLTVVWGKGAEISFYKNTPLQSALITSFVEDEEPSEDVKNLKLGDNGSLESFHSLFPDIADPCKACSLFTQFLKDPSIIESSKQLVTPDEILDIWTLSHYYDVSKGMDLCDKELGKKLKDGEFDGDDIILRRFKSFFTFVNGRVSELQNYLNYLIEQSYPIKDHYFLDSKRIQEEIFFLEVNLGVNAGNVVLDFINYLNLSNLINLKINFSDGLSLETNLNQSKDGFIKGKITFPDELVAEGEFNLDSAYSFEMRGTFSDGSILEGRFDRKTRHLISGKLIFPPEKGEDKEKNQLLKAKAKFPFGVELEGYVDLRIDKLLFGRAKFSNGEVLEGEFNLDSKEKLEGEVWLPDGAIQQGLFDAYSGKLLQGKITFPSGQIQEGEFDITTLKMSSGKIIFPCGQIQEGDFCTLTGKLVKGTITYSSRIVERGVFDHTGELIKGERRLANGEIVVVNKKFLEVISKQYIFDPVTYFKWSNLIDLKIKFVDGLILETNLSLSEDGFIKGKIIFPDKRVVEGEFKLDTEYTLEMRGTFSDGSIGEGRFNRKTGCLVSGKLIFPPEKRDETNLDPASGSLAKQEERSRKTSDFRKTIAIFPCGVKLEGSVDLREDNFLIGKAIFSDRYVLEGRFGLDSKDALKGKVTILNGQVHEGTFDFDYGQLVEGTITFPNGQIQEWKFDRIARKWSIGKIIFPCGQIHEGTFQSSKLIKGTVSYPSGNLEKGDFCPLTGKLIKGERKFSTGEVEEGDFDLITGKLIKGERKFPSSEIQTGHFDLETGKLIWGQLTFPSGKVQKGHFDRITGKLITDKLSKKV